MKDITWHKLYRWGVVPESHFSFNRHINPTWKDLIHAIAQRISDVVCISVLSGIIYYGIKNNEKEQTQYRKFFDNATKIADTNHDGTLSLDEKIKMYEDMGIAVDARGIREPTISELQKYIENHGENRK